MKKGGSPVDSHFSTEDPTPIWPLMGAVFKEAVKIFGDPFYRNGPNDQGIGWNVLASLGRRNCRRQS